MIDSTTLQNLPSNIQDAVSQFIQPYLKDDNTAGIILCGSYAYGLPTKYSDVDIHIILDQAEDRTRGNTWVNDVEIEYFINPVRQVFAYLTSEETDLRPTTVHMLHHGLVIYEKQGTEDISAIKRRAQDILQTPLPELTSIEKERYKYAVDDAAKDIADASILGNTTAYQMSVFIVIRTILEIFLRIHRTRQEKPKLLDEQLQNLDPAFARLYKDVGVDIYNKKSIDKLVAYIEKLLGGKRPREWELTDSLRL